MSAAATITRIAKAPAYTVTEVSDSRLEITRDGKIVWAVDALDLTSCVALAVSAIRDHAAKVAA